MMLHCNINQFRELVSKIPVIYEGNPLFAGLIHDATVIRDSRQLIAGLDAIEPTNFNNVICVENTPELANRFPVVKLTQEPSDIELNNAIFDNFATYSKLITTQSEIKDIILSNTEKEVIILVVIDGLSYKDCRLFNVEPCLNTTITKTKEGYLSVVGSPTVGEGLFKRGFTDLLGYSYWDREDDKEISDQIFVPFPKSCISKVKCFEEVENDLKSKPLFKTFIQIVMMGLDETCHRCTDTPIIKPLIQRIFERLKSLENIIRSKGRTGLVIMTSDHGILWKNDYDCWTLNVDGLYERTDGMRYLHGKFLRQYLKHTHFGDRNYSLLKFPQIFRAFKRNEWGTHGGISYEESVVPLYIMEVK